MDNNAFDSSTPSVFVIGSPLQALCLVSAILNLGIDDYQVVVINSVRLEQVKSVLDRFGIDYSLRFVGWHRWRMRLYRISSFFHRYNRFKRLFIGDFRNETLLYFGLQYISDGSDIVYLDDGNATIPLFDGKRTTPPLGRIDIKYATLMTRLRNISFMKYFYSIYTNLPNEKFVIKFNSLEILNRNTDGEDNRIVYIIGTNTIRYCEIMNVTERRIINILETVIQEIRSKYLQTEIRYIPHGKDTSVEVKRLCECYCVDYKKLDVPVELYFVDQHYPIAIYGFMSSALYNLKQMFPTSDVYNIFVPPPGEGDIAARKKSIAEYYNKCGIVQLDF